MNNSRLQSIENNLPAIARKVLDATPIAEAWPASAIGSELFRLCGSSVHPSTVLRCLASMKDQGLVREPEHGRFKRETQKEKPPHMKLIKDDPMPPIQKPEQKATAAKKDILGLVGGFSQGLRKIADELDEAALAIQEDQAKSDAENAKVLQLRELLSSLK